MTGSAIAAEPPSQGSSDGEKGTYLGVLFSAVPQPVYAQVPDSFRDRGILVNFVLPDSPAAKAGLKRYDILLRYDDNELKDCDQFADLIRNDSPGRGVKLTFLRGGAEHTVQAKLDLGPALKVAQAGSGDKTEVPKGTGKPPPGGVSLSVKPLEGGLWNVLVEYRDEKSGELRSIPIERKTLKEVDEEIVKLPTSIQSLTKSAWSRARERLEGKNDDKK
jgi:membrane-associated protease RseP (regulator of RpoE activity)